MLPSEAQGLSITALEAAAGMAIVVNNVGSMSELFQHELTGMWVDTQDSNVLADVWLELYRLPEKRFNLGVLGINALDYCSKHVSNGYVY